MDLRCYVDLDLFAAECDDPLEELEQDNFHRIVEAPGSNLDDPDRGLGISSVLSGVADRSLGPRAEAELLKDPRNRAVRARVSSDGDGSYRMDLEVEADEGVVAMAVGFGADGVRRVS